MIYPYNFVVSAERNRDRAYETVIKALEKAANETGISRKQIAETLGCKPSQVSTWLSGPSNWTLDTIDHLLRSVGAEMEYNVVFDRDRHKSNFHIMPDYGQETVDTVQILVPPAPTSTTASASIRMNTIKLTP